MPGQDRGRNRAESHSYEHITRNSTGFGPTLQISGQIAKPRYSEAQALNKLRVGHTRITNPTSRSKTEQQITLMRARGKVEATASTALYGSAPPGPASPLQRSDSEGPPYGTSRRANSAPAHASSICKYADDDLHELYDNWRTMAQIRVLEKYFLDHLFCGKIDQERKYFEAPKWSTRELRVTLVYALQIAELTVKHYRKTIVNSKKKSSEAVAGMGLLDFVQPGEVTPGPLSTPMLLAQLRNSDFEKIAVDSETAPAIAFLGIIKTRVLNHCEREHRGGKMLTEDERRELLRAWLECPKRVEYTLPRVPMKLLQPQFTRQDLNWAAIYVKTKRQHHLQDYCGLWHSIGALGMADRVEAKGCLSYDDLHKFIRIHLDMVNFDLYPDKYIWDNRWTPEDLDVDIGHEKKFRIRDFQFFGDWKSEIERGRIHRNGRWSIAEYAKQAKWLEIEYRKLKQGFTSVLSIKDTTSDTVSPVSPVSSNEEIFRLSLDERRDP